MVLVVPEGEHVVRLGHERSIKQRARAQKGRLYGLTFSFVKISCHNEWLKASITANGETYPLCKPCIILTLMDSMPVTILYNPVKPKEDPAYGPLTDTVVLIVLDPTRLTYSYLRLFSIYVHCRRLGANYFIS